MTLTGHLLWFVLITKAQYKATVTPPQYLILALLHSMLIATNQEKSTALIATLFCPKIP